MLTILHITSAILFFITKLLNINNLQISIIRLKVFFIENPRVINGNKH